MFQKTISTELNQTIEIEAKRNLYLTGSTDNQVVISTEEERFLNVQVLNQVVRIRCERDCAITAPANLLLKVLEAHGNMTLIGWQAEATISRVGGNLSVEGVGSLSVDNVGGDCSVQKISGSFRVNRVGGDLSCKDVQNGTATAGSVGGDTVLVEASGGLNLRTGGDAIVQFREITGQTVHIVAGGDVQVLLPDNANIDLRATSGAMNLGVRANGQAKRIQSGVYEGKIGAGGTRMELSAGGEITVSDTQTQGVEEKVESAPWMFGASAWQDKINRKTEKAVQKAERKMEKAQQKMNRGSERAAEAMRRAQERVQAAMRSLEGREGIVGEPPSVPFGFQPSETPPGVEVPNAWAQAEQPAESEPQGVSDEEKALILHMLQEKKISVEEADRLLAALEDSSQS